MARDLSEERQRRLLDDFAALNAVAMAHSDAHGLSLQFLNECVHAAARSEMRESQWLAGPRTTRVNPARDFEPHRVVSIEWALSRLIARPPRGGLSASILDRIDIPAGVRVPQVSVDLTIAQLSTDYDGHLIALQRSDGAVLAWLAHAEHDDGVYVWGLGLKGAAPADLHRA